jgi:hypothetical protein
MAFPIHPHMLRHGCSYALANVGHDTRAIQAAASVAKCRAPQRSGGLASTLAHGQEEHRQDTGGSYQQYGDGSY